MASINIKRELPMTVEEGVTKITQALQQQGFGVLTRIDFHSKIKEKLNEDIAPAVILGACDPKLALAAYRRNSDVTSLLPCNVVVRSLGANRVSVEIVKASALLAVLGDSEMTEMAREADLKLAEALESLMP